MSLAQALLERGRPDVVIVYLDLCSSFWKGFGARHFLKKWRRAVRRREVPDFRPNMLYGTGERGYVA
jgi:hypothetical protein